jgi:hypothetical protein
MAIVPALITTGALTANLFRTIQITVIELL